MNPPSENTRLHSLNPFARVTAGPSPLLTDFYCTNYAHDYFRKHLHTKPRKLETSGVTKNVAPYVQYNKLADETNPRFRYAESS